MTVTVDGTLGVTTPRVTLAGTGTNILQPSATAGTFTQTLPAGSGQLLLSSVTMNFPTSLGSAGQVLTTDGAGNLSWSAGGGGGGSPAGVAGDVQFNNGGTFGAAPDFRYTTAIGVSRLTLGSSGGNIGSLFLANTGTGGVDIRPSSLATIQTTLTLPPNFGSSGQVLSTDGAGNLYWGAGGGGGGMVYPAAGVAVSTGTAWGASISLGTGVALALQNNVGSVGGFVTLGGALGTPSSAILTNATGLPLTGGLGVTGVLPIANGGTGLNTVGAANEVLVSNGTSAVWATLPPSGDIAGGSAGQIPYQAAANTTAFIPTGGPGQILQSNGTSAPTWVNIPNAPSISGGAASQVLYQSSPGVTAFVPNGTIGQSLLSNGVGAPSWGPVDLSLAAAVTGILPPSRGGTGITSLGTGVAAALGNPAGGANGIATLNSSGVLPASQGGVGGAVNAAWTSILGIAPGTGVGTALGINVGSAGSFVTNGGALGTPSSGVLTNATGLPLTGGLGVTGILPIANGGTGLGTIGTANQVLTSDGTNAVWSNASTLAGSLSGGAASRIPYQTAANTTAFLPNGTSGQVLTSFGAAAPQWVSSFITLGTTTVNLNATALTLAGLTTVTVTQDPVNPLDLSTKQYVDLATSSVNRMAPVDAATTGPVTLSGTQTVDGVTVTGGERVLVKNQASASQNGVYVVGTPWTYATDANTWNEYVAAQVYVLNGATQDATSWIQTQPAGGTLGVTNMLWEQTSGVNSYAAGTGLTQIGNVFNNAGVLSFSGGPTGLLPNTPTTGAVALSGTLLPGYGGTGLTALGTGVQTALGNNTNSANGLAVLNVSGVLAPAQGGTGISSLGSGVAAALGTNVGAVGGFLSVGASPLTNNGVVIGTSVSGDLASTAAGITGQILTGVTGSAPTWASTVTLGTQGTTAGLLRLANTNAGAFPTSIVSSNAATAAWTLTLPVDDGVAGQVLQTDGNGVTSWVNNDSGIVLGTTTITGGTNSRILYNNGGVVGEYPIGTGVAAALATNVGSSGGLMVTGTTPLTPYGVVVGSTTVGELNTVAVGQTGQVLVGNTGTNPSWSSTVTLGVQSTTAGILRLANTNAGAFQTSIQSSSSATAAWTLTLPVDDGTVGQYLTTDGSGVTSWTTPSTTPPGGATTQVQFNNAGAFGGNANFTWDNTNGRLILGSSGGLTGGLRLFNTATANPVTIQSGVNSASWTMTLPVDDGTAGQLLSTDGNGVTSWVSAAGSPGGATTQVQYNNAGAFGANANFTYNGTGVINLGTVSSSTGGIKLANVGSANLLTIEAGINASAWTFTFPTGPGTAGQVLTTNGAGSTSWTAGITVGTTTIASGAVNGLLYQATGNVVGQIATANGGILNTSSAGVPSITATPTLGVAGTTAGTLALSGSTSGTVTLQSQAAASGTITLPNGNATLLASSAALTQGSVLFSGASGVISQDNANFFWDDSNNRLGIGTATPAQQLHVLNSGTATIARFANASNTIDIVGGSATTAYVGDSTAVNAVGFDTTGNFVDIRTNSTNRARIDSNGNVNIATTGQAAKLYVNGNTASNISALGNSSGTVTLDFATANNFSATLTGATTLANPTNLLPGQSGVVYLTQDATGGRTVAYGANWDFPGGTAPTASTAANAVDVLVYTVRSSTSIAAQLLTGMA